MMSIGFRNNNSVGTTAYIDAVAYDQSIGATDIRFSTYSGSGWNSNMVTFQHTGRVGIGTVSPNTKLHISSAALSDIRLENTGTAIGSGENYGQIEWEGNDYNTGANGIRASIQVKGYGAGTQGETGMYFRTSYIGADSNVDRMVISHLGNVGIGTNSPGYKLEVESTTDADLVSIKSTAIANNTQLRLGISGNDSVISGTGGSTGNLVFKTYGSERMRIDSSGFINFSKTATTATAVASINHASNDFLYINGGAAGASFGDDSQSTRMIAYDSDYLRFDTAGTGEKMRIDSSGNVKLAITNATSSTTIGKDGGGMWMETAGSTNALSDMRFQARASGAGSYSAIKIKPSNQSLEFQTSNTVRMGIDSSGNVGINDTGPDHTLSVGGTAKISSGLLVGSMTLITNFTAPYFTHLTADLNVDLVLGNTPFWGHLEVTITGTYSNQNTPGKLTKIYAVGLNLNGTIYTNVSRVSDAMGPVVTQINLGEVRWDSTTSTYRIRIAHIASTGNQYWIQVKGFTASGLAESTLPDLGISALYTQSTTGLLAQIPSFKTEMATFSAATGSTSGIISANSGYITSFSNSATHASSNSALFVPVANGIKITQAGLIQVTLTQDFISTSSASYASVSIRKNAGVIAYSLRTNSNSQWDMFNSTTTMQVAANDEIGFHYQAGDFTSMDTGGWSQYSFIWTSL
jgi:hypothetical protein